MLLAHAAAAADDDDDCTTTMLGRRHIGYDVSEWLRQGLVDMLIPSACYEVSIAASIDRCQPGRHC